MGFQKGQGGRKAGAKNLKTRKKEAVAATAMVAANTAIISPDRRKRSKAVSTIGPRPGMSAKDIMVDAMREAHDNYRAQCIKASDVMQKADDMSRDALELAIDEDEKPDDFKARQGAALASAQIVRDQAFAIRSRAGESLALALDTAHKVAPYDHARLQASTVQGDLQLHVTIAKF